MKTITFRCETITPMFLAGADGRTPELRPPSIKGALRFWWRALHGHLSLTDLKKKEVEIFGGSYKDEDDKKVSRRSNVIISIDNHRDTEKSLKKNNHAVLVPHRNTTQKAFVANQEFNVVFQNINETTFSTDTLIALFKLACILGGFGKRTRRGMGSLKINKYKIGESNWNDNTENMDLDNIKNLLNLVNSKFLIENDVIKSNFIRDEKYPYIKTIQIGENNDNLLFKISKKTSELHKNYQNQYDFAMGYAKGKKRFSSPIFVSTLNEEKAIITTLNTIPKDNGFINNQGITIQNEFKNAILKK